MQLSNRQALPTSQQNAWDALNNIEVLQNCIPGCESLTEVPPGQYEILITAAVGPVKAKFKGKLRIADPSPPSSYRIEFEGQGGAAGHGKGSASVRLEPTSAERCDLVYEANASVGGKIAQIGQRLVDVAAQKMAGEFFAAFEKQIAELYPLAPVPAEASPSAAPKASLWARIQRVFVRLLGKRKSV